MIYYTVYRSSLFVYAVGTISAVEPLVYTNLCNLIINPSSCSVYCSFSVSSRYLISWTLRAPLLGHVTISISTLIKLRITIKQFYRYVAHTIIRDVSNDNIFRIN